jgi:5-methylcytosine-specific restriction endonuclease McrA
MNDILRQETVLVLNRNWQAIHVKNPAEAVSMMYSDSATGLDILGEDHMIPLRWNDWINLPYDENARYIKTIRGNIKIPKVIVLCNFDRVPKKRPKFTSKSIWMRDNGICQYTGKKLKPNEGNIDHVLPKSRGGASTWTNCVLAHKEINSKKADRTLEESGLKLIRQPQAPKELPVTFYIRNKHNIKEWNVFLKGFVNN